MVAELRVLQQLNDYEFGVQLRILRSGPNRNKWSYQNIDKFYQTFLGTPILIAYVHGRIGLGHEMKERRDENGQPYYSFMDGTSERIVGTISDDPNDIWLEEEDGETWIVAKGRLFTFYNKELVDEIVRKGSFEVSAETEVNESYMDGEIEVFTSWVGLGITILGEGVAPAVPGANIKALRTLASEFKELKLKAAAYIKNEEEPDDQDEGEDDDPDTDEPDDADEDDPEASDVEPEKPQITKNEGERQMQIYSKKQVAEIAPKFDGYAVLSAGQDESGIHVCLMSDDGATAVYTLDSIDAVIDPKKITKVNACVGFKFGEESIDVEASELTDRLSASLIAANSAFEALKVEAETAKTAIENMKAMEAKRRISAAKAKAVATLEQFNANRDEKVDATVLDTINEAIDNGDYSECVNGEGEWCGEDAVCEAVLAKCAAAVMEFDKARVARNSVEYIWDTGKGAAPEGDDVSALLAKWKKKTI